ncbi:MAG: ABC transporter substrate-binding protein [Anaerolineae bacterium]
MNRGLTITLGIIAALILTLSACTTPTPRTIVETVVVEHTVEVVKTEEVAGESPATPPPEATVEPKTLAVCISEEPETLYWFGGTTQTAATHIFEAIYDGPIDNRTYDHQPVILEKLPGLEDGDAVIDAVTVQQGDIVVNDQGDVVELTPGEIIRPASCGSTECAVEFDGTPVQMDQMAATFKMREGLTWSNGERLTADDSVYGFELQADPDTPSSRYLVERTASYRAPDDVTTVWTGLPGFVDELYYTNFWHPFPRHLWQEELGYAAADLIEAEESARTPMGWGAFMITAWAQGDHITVERNPHYFRADEGLPYLETIIFHFVSDPNAAAAKLISGECDVATHDISLMEQAELLLELEREDLINLVFENTGVWEHIDFGINPADDYDRPDFFEDSRTRSAIAYCLDRQRAIDLVLYGQSPVLDSYLPPSHPLYAGDMLTTYGYDPEQGQALLEEVGWIDEDSDGIREANDVEGVPNGTPFEITFSATMSPAREKYIPLVREDLAECGISINVETLPVAEFYAEGPTGPLFGRRFDLAAFAWLAHTLPSCEYYLGTDAHIPSEENQWSGYNVSGFRNEEYDAACLQALGSVPESEAWIEGHKEAQRLFSEQLPAIPLFLHIDLAATRPEVVSFALDPTEESEMWSIEVLDLENR